MADINSRLPQNAPGPWYVDDTCIDCDLCRDTAPTVFRRDDDHGNSIVFHQPETPEELSLSAEAKANCPVEAIGSDGPPLPTGTKEPGGAIKSPSDDAPRHG